MCFSIDLLLDKPVKQLSARPNMSASWNKGAGNVGLDGAIGAAQPVVCFHEAGAIVDVTL